MEIRVARISIAPVKSLGLVHPDRVELRPGGVQGDRRFWLVDEDGRLLNNKRSGPLVTIRPEWDEETRELTLRFPDGATVGGVVELGQRVTPGLYGRPHPSRRVLGPWEEAIAAHVGQPVRLLWSESHATDRGRWGGEVSLVSRASLDRLGEEAGSVDRVDGRRFRMLLELEGLDALEEERWRDRRVRAGEAMLLVGGPTPRCAVPSASPDTGRRDRDVLRELLDVRGAVDGESCLGVYAEVLESGVVRVGDAVEPL